MVERVVREQSGSFCSQHSGIERGLKDMEDHIEDCKENRNKQWLVIDGKVDGRNFRWLMGMIFVALLGMGGTQIATYQKVSKMEIKLEQRAKLDGALIEHIANDKIMKSEDINK